MCNLLTLIEKRLVRIPGVCMLIDCCIKTRGNWMRAHTRMWTFVTYQGERAGETVSGVVFRHALSTWTVWIWNASRLSRFSLICTIASAVSGASCCVVWFVYLFKLRKKDTIESLSNKDFWVHSRGKHYGMYDNKFYFYNTRSVSWYLGLFTNCQQFRSFAF